MSILCKMGRGPYDPESDSSGARGLALADMIAREIGYDFTLLNSPFGRVSGSGERDDSGSEYVVSLSA